MASAGRTLMRVGGALALTGGVVLGLGRLGLTLGRLPGDLRWQGHGWAVHLPLATSALVSLLVSLWFGVFQRR
jgi:hypothetical protein